MKISFQNRLLMALFVGCLFCTVAAIFISSQKIKQNGVDALVEKSRVILSRLEVGAKYVAGMETLDSVIAETVKKFPDGRIPEDQKLKVLKSVPIYAAFQLGQTGADKENYQFRVASDKPRNKDNAATPSEKALIEKFRANPSLLENTEVTPDGQFIRVSRPVRIMKSQGCLNCHGHPDTSPWHNGKDILGYDMENMQDGEIRGTFTVISSMTPVLATASTSTRDISLWGLVIALIALVMAYLVVKKPLSIINKIAEDLSAAATVVADMSNTIAKTSESLSSGATEQAAALQETSASMEEVRAMVAKNSDNAENSAKSAGASMETAEKGKTVVQEMLQSIGEIDESNNQIMLQVHESNQQIGEIVKVISDISN